VTVKLLIDECLHTSLVELAHAAGHVADHVNYLGLGSSKDWHLIKTVRQQDYTFVTNNRSDFLLLRKGTVARRSDHYCSQCRARSSAGTLHRGT
jgi:predicted nuclease of predicted toxin-antitoxin system